MAQKISISYEDVNSAQVDQRLRRQDEAARNYQPPPPPPVPGRRGRSHGILYNTAVYTTLFGLIGGGLGWACGEIPRRLMPNHKAEFEELVQAEQMIQAALDEQRLRPIQAQSALARLEQRGLQNPYYRIARETAPAEREAALAQVEAQNARAELVADLFFFAMAGLMLATMLAIADALVERNIRAAIINGSVGAALGMAGGVVAAFTLRWVEQFVDKSLSEIAFPGASPGGAQLADLLKHAITWGVMGMFLAVAPGVVMRNGRKLLIGLVGGALGGILGGLLFEPIALRTGHDISRLLAISAIGAVAGLAVGLIENVAKRGWLRVTEGLIAGKQFILYRNPTYIGSALSCSIYLFRDPSVGPRHAAIHLVPGGFELEDLPLGTRTTVNGKPIRRHRLRDGDEIRIGQTTLEFHAKKA